MSLEKQPTSRQKAEMMSFCLKNGIKIYLHPLNDTEGSLVVEQDGKKPIVGKEIFNIAKLPKRQNSYQNRVKHYKWCIAIENGYKYYYELLNKNK